MKSNNPNENQVLLIKITLKQKPFAGKIKMNNSQRQSE